MLQGPVLGTCSFWALLSYNLESYHGVSQLEHMHHVGLGMWIGDEWVCPSQGFLLQLNREEMKERGWDEASVERKMKIMVDENM